MGWMSSCCAAGTMVALTIASAFGADDRAPDRVIQAMTSAVLDAVRTEPVLRTGDLEAVSSLVDHLVLPNVDMARLTALSMGQYWRTASADQQRRLQIEFKALIVRSYAGALAHVGPTQQVETRPLRVPAAEQDVVVSTAIRGQGEPIRIDYRMRHDEDGWKIYDVSVLGVWLAENYRGSFAQEIGRTGIEGLIARLHARNEAAPGTSLPERSAR